MKTHLILTLETAVIKTIMDLFVDVELEADVVFKFSLYFGCSFVILHQIFFKFGVFALISFPTLSLTAN